MNRLFVQDFSSGTYPEKLIPDLFAKFVAQFFSLPKINRLYKQNQDKSGIEFVNALISELNIQYEIQPEELKRIPQAGPFIIISNHPLGGLDALLLLKIVSEIRPDFKFLANYMLHNIEPIQKYSIPTNEVFKSKLTKPSFSGIKKALSHLKSGGCMGIFPAGRVSIYRTNINNVVDRKWQQPLIKFIRKANIPIIPVYFKGHNTLFFHILGNIHPLLQAARFPTELFKKKNKNIAIRIGNPISVKEQNEFPDIGMLTRFLRAKTYALGTTLAVKKFFSPKFIPKIKNIEPIIEPIPEGIVIQEIEDAKQEHLLFNSGNFSVICAPSSEIPNTLNEIGRLREITFRAVGEGTNKSLDLDEFDLYFNHLIIWDDEAKKIAGAYRVGKGKDILEQYGATGFYIHSLFKMNKGFYPYLAQSLELGRSFIISEYQKKPLSLFLLWKGILYFILKNKEYRYLIGPASISNEFSKFSKGLIVEFFETHYFDRKLAEHVKPRKRFKIPKDKVVEKKILLENTGNDLTKLDKYIQDIEPKFRLPVLLKKYINLNARIIAFNVDPKFNDCIDGLMFLDIFDVPMSTIKGLSKEINDDTILDRFHLNEE